MLRIAPLTCLVALTAAACSAPEAPQTIGTLTQAIRAGASPTGDVFVGADLLVTETGGEAVPCDETQVEFTVEVSRNGADGPYQRVDAARVYRACSSPGQGQLAMVVDNSGSLADELDTLQAAALRVSDAVIDRGGEVSLTRVSTNSRVLSELSDDRTAVEDAIDSLFIGNGWTALYDGVRMGHQTLGEASRKARVETFDDAGSFCDLGSQRGLLVLSDSAENNSSHQMHWSADYPGDGIDTNLDDLMQLNVGDAATPIYTVGLGDADHDALTRLAAATGGRHAAVDGPDDIEGVLSMLADYGPAAHRVCTALPDHLCGSLDVRISHRFETDEGPVEGSTTRHLELPCAARAQGRVATLLLTLSASDMQPDAMSALIAQTVNWASPVDAPRVLFVRDDFHHNEFATDTAGLYDTLQGAGYVTALLDEPTEGISMDDLEGYDVVWFSNPGYPMDDLASFNALLQFSEAGGGVVLQGDDMSWSHGESFSTEPLTRLEHVNNGTSYCGQNIDNGRGGRYEVSFATESHPLIAGLEGQTFLYGDDIDTTVVGETPGDSQVLAWATVADADGCEQRKPVITAFTPSTSAE